MLRRPTLDEVLLAVFAIVVFIAVQLGDDGDDAAEVTATPTPSAAAPAAATPTAATTTVDETATPAAATPTVSETGTPVPPTVAAGETATPTATLAATAVPTSDPDDCDFRDERERVRGAVVRIRVPGSGSQGTGFHIGRGEYVTAAHVVQDESGETQGDILIGSAVTGSWEPAVVVKVGSFSNRGRDQQRDLALLRAPPIEHRIDLNPPEERDTGRDVRALGYPWSQAPDDSASIPPPVVLRGVLSSTAELNGIAIVQSDVRVQSGMSGGPLVDECGDALAVAASLPRALGDEAGEGIGVFISMAELANLR